MAACDSGARPPDAQAAVSLMSAELRSGSMWPTANSRPFRCSASAPPPPVQTRPTCSGWSIRFGRRPRWGWALRDADEATSALVARGKSIDLEEFSGVGVGLGPGEPLMRLDTRVFPDVAGVVGGVVAEAAPQPLDSSP